MNTKTPSNSELSQATLIQLATGYWIAQCLYVTAKLGIADFIQETPQYYEQLASLTATHAPSLYRLLRALASLGVFEESEFGYFGLGKFGSYLQSDRADSLRTFIMMQGEEHYQAWAYA